VRIEKFESCPLAKTKRVSSRATRSFTCSCCRFIRRKKFFNVVSTNPWRAPSRSSAPLLVNRFSLRLLPHRRHRHRNRLVRRYCVVIQRSRPVLTVRPRCSQPPLSPPLLSSNSSRWFGKVWSNSNRSPRFLSPPLVRCRFSSDCSWTRRCAIRRRRLRPLFLNRRHQFRVFRLDNRRRSLRRAFHHVVLCLHRHLDLNHPPSPPSPLRQRRLQQFLSHRKLLRHHPQKIEHRHHLFHSQNLQ
jgi:hypothetical protein